MATCEYCGREFKPAKRTRRFRSKSCSNLGQPRGVGKPTGITSYSGLYYRLQKMYPDPEPCAECGEPGQHRHHPDYRKPLKIIWLCAACQACYTRCPKGVDLSRIMEAIREIVMYEEGSHIDYDAIPPEEIVEWPQQAFIGGFRKYSV